MVYLDRLSWLLQPIRAPESIGQRKSTSSTNGFKGKMEFQKQEKN